jgi:hypothetical protein
VAGQRDACGRRVGAEGTERRRPSAVAELT